VDLKKSQHYPALFGHSVAQLYQREASAIQEEVKKQQKLGSVGYQLLSFTTAELMLNSLKYICGYDVIPLILKCAVFHEHFKPQ